MKQSVIKAMLGLLGVCALAVFLLPIDANAGTVPPEILAGIEDDEPNPLPRYATPEEQQQLLQEQGLLQALGATQSLESQTASPSGVVWTPGEYAPCHGALVRWGAYNSLLTEFIVGIAHADSDSIAFVLVETDSQRASCASTLESAGADMDRVRFITYDGDSVWIRDYGPLFFSKDSTRAIMDHTYNRNRPKDNAFPAFLAQLWNEPLYDIGLEHGGGNFLALSNGDAFMSTLILDENPGYSENEIKQLFKDYLNVNLTIYESLPSTIDATGHIDMWMIPLSDTDILISQFSSGTGKTITDAGADDLESGGYTVWRTPAWTSGGTHYTYTNAAVVNNRVFIPYYGGSYSSNDATALAVFQEAMPDHEIIQVDCSSIISAAGAIHCAMKHVFAIPTPFADVLTLNTSLVLEVGQQQKIKWIAHDDVQVTSVDIYYSTDGGFTFPHAIATDLQHIRSYIWTVPDTISDQCRIKVIVYDADGNIYEDISDADFSIDSSLLRDDFETGFGNWTNVTGDKDDWYRDQGSTPSNNTGPNHDNTIGDSTSSYIYMETSSGYCYASGDEARLEGPDLDAGTYSLQLSFYYHMYGSNMGTLNVDVYDGTTWQNGVWSKSGQQHSSSGADYTKATVDLDAYTGTIKIRFRGVAAGGYRGDMAIDDIRVTGVPRAPDTDPPTPDPMTWATPPYATGTTLISMTATTASDASGVEYYFACVAGGGHNSGWQDSPTFEDTGLSPDTEYTYQVKARDKSGNQNETAFSSSALATTEPEDTTPPTPDPMTWATPPYTTGTTSISMTATAASDDSGVQYYFACVAGGGHDSGWQNSTIYEDIGLNPNTLYAYQVKARDKSVNQNETAFSASASATTEPEDTTPPTPDLMTWATVPYATGSGSIAMVATTATDPSGVEYYFDEITGNPGGSDSGWQDSTSYTDTGLSPETQYTYTVTARDKSVNQNETAASTAESATTEAAPAQVSIIGSWVSGTSHAKESGSDRALIFTAHAEDDNTDMDASVTYGGQSMTKVVEYNEGSGYRAYAAAFVLDEAGIAAASGSTFNVSWNQSPSRTPGYSSVFLEGVDQATPVRASDGNGGTTGTVTTAALATDDGDMVILAGTCGATGSYSAGNGFTEAIELTVESGDGIAGYKQATGANETPSITHSAANRQAIVGLVVQAGGVAPPDTTPPSPDPMTWASVPQASGSTSLSMTATTASDTSGVEYYFECTVGGGHDSGWQDSPAYEDTGLTPDTQYTYRVKARDKSPNQNETGWSTTQSATTEPEDTIPPGPDPMTWASVPAATGTTSILMEATTASDASGVEYYFECAAGGGHDSGWQDSATYEDTGLSPDTQYTYRVKARDKSANQNETAWSSTASATTNPPSGWTQLTYDDFEASWGSYTDGGSDCRRSSGDSAYAHQGSYCARIRDNSGTASSLYYTNGVDVASPGYTQLKIDFWFYPRSMESGEDFWVQYYDGSNWHTVASYARGTDFSNGQFYHEEVYIDKASYTFSTNMRIRFMCDASGNNDYIYIDEVEVSGQ